MRCRFLSIIVALLTFSAASNCLALDIISSTYVGQPGDGVVAVAIQKDGSIVFAANVSAGPFKAGKGGGMVCRLSADGSKLLAKTALGGRVHDLSSDGKDNLYVATTAGIAKLDAQASKILWRKDLGRVANRIDAGTDGHCVALCYDRPEQNTATGASQMFVFDPNGKELGKFKGQHFTIDVCLDAGSNTVIYTGFRNARAFDGKKRYPVQIAYVIGRSYTGKEKYRLYDWPTKREAPGFLNKKTNNMADTRGYRCAIGRDGKLYCAFECAGGNHIFRWEPQLNKGEWVRAQGKKPRIDKYHAFYNSRAEHKTFMGRYHPATGEYLRGQEFCARLSSGRANAVRVKRGALTAAEDGAILLGGTAAASLPTTLLAPGTGDYKGGAFLLLMKPDLTKRQACVRVLPSSTVHAVAIRKVGEKRIVVAGGSITQKAADKLHTKQAIQKEGKPGSGFLIVLVE